MFHRQNLRLAVGFLAFGALSDPALGAERFANTSSGQVQPSRLAAVPDPRTWGPYGVGVTTLTFEDPARGGRPLVTDIWYPALTEAGAPGEYYLHLAWGMATRDAPVDPSGGPYPLLMFSHGYAGIRDQSLFFTEHMASHGYVVVAPDHFGNTFYHLDETLSADSVIDRPLDITFLIDQVLGLNKDPGSSFHELVDDTRIGMSGHSFGGYTALVIGGVEVQLDACRSLCAQGSDADCETVRYAESLYGSGIQWLNLADPRVNASIPMAPGIYDYFQADGLASAFVPMGVMASMEDNTMPYLEQALPIYEALTVERYLFALERRDHYAFTSIFDVRPMGKRRCRGYVDCAPRDPSHEVVNTFATAFLGYTLLDMQDYAPYLSPDYYEINTPGQALLITDP